ncbi:type I pullulanase [Paenibacillus glufosinatiresistens]|nr:type I pullulanase [Paenibacillus sp. YX.27]
MNKMISAVNAEWVIEEYRGRDLGLTYTKEESLFKVWAPAASAVSLVLYESGGVPGESAEEAGDAKLALMSRQGSGLWEVRIAGDLAGLFYMFRAVYEDGTVKECPDPYAFAVSANGLRSAIVDLRETDPEGWEADESPRLAHPVDAVLYELHVRDFSIHESLGAAHRGQYLAFTEGELRDDAGNRLGVDHLAELGITHVHLMPVFDYQTVDELDQGGPRYNWGYDPQHYNAPEGSYSTDPADPRARIREFKKMVQALHARGIGVVMDVVYNHTYAVDTGPFEGLAPGYFYRRDPAGRLTNGSGVGNELATERPMVRKYIKDSLRYWLTEYHIDGFRFDLMGVIDTVTMREIAEELRIDFRPDLLFYGEPWTGGDSPLMNKTLKGAQKGKGYAVFNDNYRSAIKGDNDGWGRGYATGEWGREGAVAAGIKGAIHDFADSPRETVNYVSAHDNLNLWDKILTVQGLRGHCRFPDLADGRLVGGGDAEEAIAKADPYAVLEEGELLQDETVRRSLLASALVLTSQGIPFLQAGDELLRSKFGDHNSYRSSDSINAIRWGNKARFRQVFDYYRGLIALRKQHPAFRLRGRQEVERALHFTRCDGGVVSYLLKDHAGGDAWRNIAVLFNANPWPVTAWLPPSEEGWQVVADHTGAGTETLRRVEGPEITVEGLSLMILYDLCEEPRPRSRTIEIHYEREDGDYRGWNLWVWGTGIQDGQCDFTRLKDGRAVALLEVQPETASVGYLLRLNDWEAKDGSADCYIDCSGEEDLIRVRIRGAGGMQPDSSLGLTS